MSLMPDLPEDFLRGVALFNDGKYFECHEAWEMLWLKSEGVEREFLHAIIQAAAALHHHQRGNLPGASGVGWRACEKLGALPPSVMCLDTRRLRFELEQYLTETGVPPPGIELLNED